MQRERSMQKHTYKTLPSPLMFLAFFTGRISIKKVCAIFYLSPGILLGHMNGKSKKWNLNSSTHHVNSYTELPGTPSAIWLKLILWISRELREWLLPNGKPLAKYCTHPGIYSQTLTMAQSFKLNLGKRMEYLRIRTKA